MTTAAQYGYAHCCRTPSESFARTRHTNAGHWRACMFPDCRRVQEYTTSQDVDFMSNYPGTPQAVKWLLLDNFPETYMSGDGFYARVEEVMVKIDVLHIIDLWSAPLRLQIIKSVQDVEDIAILLDNRDKFLKGWDPTAAEKAFVQKLLDDEAEGGTFAEYEGIIRTAFDIGL